MDWEVLLKKNPPDKFLRRPPVRFLFDVFQYVGTHVASGLLPAMVGQAEWDTVSASKQNKVDFMESVRIYSVTPYSLTLCPL
jgi:hypothetical protein